jgi:hypothetical protein
LVVIALIIGAASFSAKPEESGGRDALPPSSVPPAPSPGDDRSTSGPDGVATSTSNEPGEDVMGTPLLGSGSPEDTIVTRTGYSYVDFGNVSIDGKKTLAAVGSLCGACGSDNRHRTIAEQPAFPNLIGVRRAARSHPGAPEGLVDGVVWSTASANSAIELNSRL